MRKSRVLLSALVFSAAWHLFWLSALTVVVVPKDAKPAKFSSVSFLGPILEASMLKVSPATHERSMRENRYLSEIVDLAILMKEKTDPGAHIEADLNAGTDIFEYDEILTDLSISAIDGDKTEPGSFQ